VKSKKTVESKYMKNHSLLSFHPDNFNYPNTPEPPSTSHHVVGEKLEEAQEGICHQGINCHIPLPPPSQHQHHTIGDEPFLDFFLSTHSQSSHALTHVLIFPTDFILKSRFFFLTSSPHPRDARYQDEELCRRNGLFITFSHQVLIVRLQVLLQEVDPLRLFGESKCY
jgi:hypothetical protein